MNDNQTPQYEVVDREMLIEDGQTLRYAVAFPRQTEPSSQRPLIIALHYGWQGDVPRYYGRGYLESLVLPALSNLEAVLVAPDCPDVDWYQPTSEKALLALIEQMQEEFPIASNQVAFTGFSLGGMGTWFMANSHPGQISAAIPVAAPPVVTRPDVPVSTVLERLSDGLSESVDGSAISVPIYAIHGREDEVIPLAPVENAVNQLIESGAPVRFVVVDGATHYNLGRYFTALRDAGEWLLDLWGRDENR